MKSGRKSAKVKRVRTPAKRKKKKKVINASEDPLDGHWGKTKLERERLLRQYEEVDISELHEWENNPRINEHAIPKVAELIEQHGFAGVLPAVTPDGTVWAGNTRFAAAKRVGMKKIWVHWKNFPSVAAAEAFALADNKSNEWADWDYAKLTKMFKKRAKVDMEIIRGASGFSTQEIDWQGRDAVDPDKIPDWDDDNREVLFILRIQGIRAEHKEQMLEAVNKLIEDNGYDYVAKLY